MKRAVRLFALLVCPLALTLAAPDAAAQGKKAGSSQPFGKKKPGSKADPKMEEAKRLFDEGAKHYTEGNYEKAVEAWEMSYDISKKELIFESIANAYERLGQAKKAREYLLKWRDVAPEEEHGTLDSRVKNLEERIAREEQAEKEQAEQKRREEEQRAREKREREEAAKAPPILGIAVAGAGAALVVGGVVLDLVAVGKRPDEAQACRAVGERQVCRVSDQDAIKSSNTLAFVGDVMWIAGGVTAAVGAVLIVTHLTSTPKANATGLWIAPVAGPTGAGVAAGARF